MKKIFTCFIITAFCFVKTETLSAQINIQDSLALVDLYNSTDGAHWRNNTNWLTANPVSTWKGVHVSNGRVTQLNLKSQNLTGVIPSSLSNLSQLNFLNFTSNNLIGDIPLFLSNLTSLEDLYLGGNQFIGTIPESFGNLTNLVYLALGANQLSGSIPETLGNLIKLQRLEIYSNQLTGSIPSSLGNLNKLLVLYLQNNQLTGSIPKSLKKLYSLVILDLSYNQLTGNIPPLGSITGLHWIHLNNNQLTGSIPPALGKLIYLEGLYLYSNKLSGEIPAGLDTLHTLYQLFFVSIQNNEFTFSGIEKLVQAYSDFPYNLTYAPQANIPLMQNGNVLSVNAGGTLGKNTYKWYKDETLVATKTGDSTLKTTGAGSYNVLVTNTIATALTLYSDTITTTSFAESENMISKAANIKTFISPNPAHNFINLNLEKPANENTFAKLYNIQGKVVMQQKVAIGSPIQQYLINNLATGNYKLVILEN